MEQSAKLNSSKFALQLPDIESSLQNPTILIYSGVFCPFNNKHLINLDIARKQLKIQNEFNVICAILIPLHDLQIRKKNNGMPLLPNKQRKDLIQAAIELRESVLDLPILSFDKLIESKDNQSLGQITVEILKQIKDKYGDQEIQVITIMSINKLNQAVAMSDYIRNPYQRIGLIMDQEVQVKEFEGLEDQILDNPLLSKTLLVLKSDYNQAITIKNSPSKEVRDLINAQNFQQLDNALSQDLIKFIIDNKIIFKICKTKNQVIQNKEEVLKDIDRNKVKIIEYSQLKQIRFWPVILGKGVQGVVEQMNLTLNNDEVTPVAVKKIKLNQQRSRRLDTFVREVRALSAIQHKNCVQMFGVGHHEDIVFTVMELCENGQSGWDFTRTNHHLFQEQFDVKIILGFAYLAEASAQMAKSGILHRDFTLDNILVFPSDEYPLFKICDFGVSATEADKHLLPRGKTRNYSPEAIIDKNNYVPRSDVYMFGLIMYEMFHNELVWNQFNTSDANEQVFLGKLPEWKVDFVPEPLVEIIYECIAFDINQRLDFEVASQKLFEVYNQLIKENH
ncbi:protein kinase domain containing protein [Stylonychia lemnae]|uniref:Protein kinase domain containing protein n=1 Tax=Stylonychia lemnae TaxID=5949 RepID=A0A078APN2_STYLE|nr:protein kinase domain containing protein [Stylonychia lemnae]|eukprot:CDW83921.1 protein kinase domain containing protein [Stylonychia lemnae]